MFRLSDSTDRRSLAECQLSRWPGFCREAAARVLDAALPASRLASRTAKLGSHQRKRPRNWLPGRVSRFDCCGFLVASWPLWCLPGGFLFLCLSNEFGRALRSVTFRGFLVASSSGWLPLASWRFPSVFFAQHDLMFQEKESFGSLRKILLQSPSAFRAWSTMRVSPLWTWPVLPRRSASATLHASPEATFVAHAAFLPTKAQRLPPLPFRSFRTIGA